MNPVPGMPQTKAAQDLLYTIEVMRYTDVLDVLDAAEEIARRDGAARLDSEHIQRALSALGSEKEPTHA